jgi:hypothetical protein
MRIYKWLRGLMKASALTTVMFIMQACYGVPNKDECEFYLSGYVTDMETGDPLEGIEVSVRNHENLHGYISAYTDSTGYFSIVQWGSCRNEFYFNFKVNDNQSNYSSIDTVLLSDTDLTSLLVKLERE